MIIHVQLTGRPKAQNNREALLHREMPKEEVVDTEAEADVEEDLEVIKAPIVVKILQV